MQTIYSKATDAINFEIEKYLQLVEETNGFTQVKPEVFNDPKLATMFAAGLGVNINLSNDDYKDFLVSEHARKIAIKFDVESAVTVGVYVIVRDHVETLFETAKTLTKEFTVFEQKIILDNPELLPVFQNLLGLSKAQLKKKVGSVSDSKISNPASKKLEKLLVDQVASKHIDKTNSLQRLEITIEGIIRDLVGRVLFEEVVANALDKAGVPYLREDDYTGLSGVVYDIRADFVIPNERNPIAFIEVRKSSSRHASLYAKDKMFSAINWKGKHEKLIGVIIVEGDWTQTTLQTMASIFDYVVPLAKCSELAKILKKAVDGDNSVLKWLIEFNISKAPDFK